VRDKDTEGQPGLPAGFFFACFRVFFLMRNAALY